MSGRRIGRVVFSVLAGFSVFSAQDQVFGQTTAPAGGLQVVQTDRRYDFDLPAQSLTTALASFSRITGLQTVTTGASLQTRESPGVRGNFTAVDALRRLLAGTGITWRMIDGNTVSLIEAPQGSSGGIVLDALTVSGEKTERTLQETATSVAVFDSKALDQRPHIASTNGLIERVPNVTTTGTNSNQAPTVRGIDGTGPTQGGYAFVAGIRSRLNLQVDGRPVSFNEQIYGDNSLWDVEQVEVLRGPQSTLQGRNAIAGAIVVKTKDPTWQWEGGGRAMLGNFSQREGAAYVSGPLIEDQLSFRLAADRQTSESFLEGTKSYPRVSDPDEFESTNLRGKLLIEPRKLDGFSTLLTLNYNKTSQPQVESVKWPEAGLVTGFPDSSPVFIPRTSSGTADTKWLVSDALTFENTFSYTDISVRRLETTAFGYAEIDGYQLQEEPRLRFTGMDGKLKGLAGLYAFHSSQDELLLISGANRYKDFTTTYATFGEATYSVLSDVDVTLGGRVERENRRRQTLQGSLTRVDLDEDYSAYLPKIGAAWHVDKTWTLGTTVAKGYNGGGAGVTFGGTSYTFRPEYVWNYEAYTRHELLDGRLQVTGNVFYADYKNMQLPYNIGVNEAIVRNAPKSHTVGSEIGARYLAAPGLTLFGNIGLLKTEIDTFTGYAGNDLPMAPALTADLGFTYDFANGFSASADGRYSEAYYSDLENRPRAKVDPYFVANLQAGYQIVPNAKVFGFVTNVFDTRAETQIDLTNNAAYIQRPRTLGVGVDVKF